MTRATFLFLIFCKTNCFGQTSLYGIHKINGIYKIDTAVILENQNLDALVNEIKNEKFFIQYTKNKIPKPILKFLKKSAFDKFTIANPGEPWQVGCIVQKKLPRRQLRFVALSANFCIISYDKGGLARSNRTAIFKFKGKEILDFWCGSGNGSETVEGILEHIELNKLEPWGLNTNIIWL